MMRILLLSAAAAIIFAGFGAIIVNPGTLGVLVGICLIVVGCVATWIIEKKTASALREDSTWNRIMKTEGDNLVGRDDSD